MKTKKQLAYEFDLRTTYMLPTGALPTNYGPMMSGMAIERFLNIGVRSETEKVTITKHYQWLHDRFLSVCPNKRDSAGVMNALEIVRQNPLDVNRCSYAHIGK